jgi:acid phosphatase type 7
LRNRIIVVSVVIVTFFAVVIILVSRHRPSVDAEPCTFGHPCPSVTPRTQPTPRQNAPDPVLMAAGDIAGRHPSAATRATGRLIAAIDPTVVLALGDAQYPAGALADFMTGYDRTWGPFLAQTRPVLGNHEYEDDPRASGYFHYFGKRSPGPYYSFDVGTWHLIALDSNCGMVKGCSRGSPQFEWLKRDLRQHDAVCTLAYWHHPRWSSGTEDGNATQVSPFVKLLYQARADVILSAHEHTYERFGPQTPSGKADPAAGLTEFVVGTGGKSLMSIGAADPNSIARSDDSFGVLQMTLHRTGYDFIFKAVLDAPFEDSGSENCH